MGSLISIPNFLFRGPAGEATAALSTGGSLPRKVAGDDEEKERDSPTWETVEKVVNHDKTDDRSYADVCRAGFEQGSLSQLRRRHFAKQSQKAPKEQQVQVQESVRLQSNHC